MTEKGGKAKKCETVGTPARGFRMEAQRCGRGLCLVACPIVGIEDFSDAEVKLKSHGGRIRIGGKRLSVTVLEGGAIEIVGRIEEIGFGYGKN